MVGRERCLTVHRPPTATAAAATAADNVVDDVCVVGANVLS